MKTARASKHILLVEPDHIQASLIARALTPSYRVRAVSGAEAAIAAADKQEPDAVVMELVLPSHNGVEFLHEFRSYPEWAAIPVVVFSQQHMPDAGMLQPFGNISYLYKPQTSLAVLKAHLLDLLQ
jgi:CheY-like chemotaxis protein